MKRVLILNYEFCWLVQHFPNTALGTLVSRTVNRYFVQKAFCGQMFKKTWLHKVKQFTYCSHSSAPLICYGRYWSAMMRIIKYPSKPVTMFSLFPMNTYLHLLINTREGNIFHYHPNFHNLWISFYLEKTQVINPTDGAIKHITCNNQYGPLKIPKELPKPLNSSTERVLPSRMWS